MIVTKSTVTKLVITEAPALDPIAVIVEDLGPREGCITITCYGSVWTAYWGGMGDKTMREFFIGAEADYLAKRLMVISLAGAQFEYVLRIVRAVQAALAEEKS